MNHAVWHDLAPLAREVVEGLGAAGWTLGTCESLTGGAIAAMLTEVPGASRVVRGSLVTYASDVKVSLAGVEVSHVEAHGVVNETVACQMAVGARRMLATDLAVSCTGVAGPTAQDGMPVGSVWLAVAGPGDTVTTRFHRFEGDRSTVRWDTGRAALELVASCLDNPPDPA